MNGNNLNGFNSTRIQQFEEHLTKIFWVVYTKKSLVCLLIVHAISFILWNFIANWYQVVTIGTSNYQEYNLKLDRNDLITYKEKKKNCYSKIIFF